MTDEERARGAAYDIRVEEMRQEQATQRILELITQVRLEIADGLVKTYDALRLAHDYIEMVGDYGEGGTSDHAVALDAVREALRHRPEIIQPASDKKVPWPSNLDPTAWK